MGSHVGHGRGTMRPARVVPTTGGKSTVFGWFRSPDKDAEKARALAASGRFMEAVEMFERATTAAEKKGDHDLAHACRGGAHDAMRDAALAAHDRAREAFLEGDRAAARDFLDDALRLAPTQEVRENIREISEDWRRGGRSRRGGRTRRDRDDRPRRTLVEDDEPVDEGPVLPEVINEADVAASMPEDDDPVELAFAHALLAVAPEDADHAHSVDPSFRDGFLALTNGRLEDAVTLLAHAREKHPDDGMVAEYHAHALLHAGRPDAREALAQVVQRFPLRSGAALSLADLLLAADDAHGARVALQRVVDARREAGDPDARAELRLADVLGRVKETDAAYTLLQRIAGEAGGTNGEMLAIAASIARAAGDAEGEEAYLRQAAEEVDAPVHAHEAFADFLAAQGGDAHAAIEHLAAARRRLARLPSENEAEDRAIEARLLRKLAHAHARAGDVDLALDVIEELEEDYTDCITPDEIAALRAAIETISDATESTTT